MRIVYFCHSLISDWNHGNAHFLRGLATELGRRGHTVRIFEPEDGWSLRNLRQRHGDEPVRAFQTAYPRLRSRFYPPGGPDLDEALAGADVVIAHGWNEPELIARLGRHRAAPGGGGYRLLFHDTHHRSATAPAEMARFDLSAFDGALVFGEAIARIYRKRRWARQVWTLHEAADTRIFAPRPGAMPEAELCWIGNWGDDERTAELEEFLLRPVKDLGIRAHAWGVRYPERAVRVLRKAGISYHGWLPNFRVPDVYARHALALHIPRRPYASALPGIPTIRVFEALACAMPLICSPWQDSEGLFGPDDFLIARDGREMTRLIRRALQSPEDGRQRALAARRTILQRHTCARRAEELLQICREIAVPAARPVVREAVA